MVPLFSRKELIKSSIIILSFLAGLGGGDGWWIALCLNLFSPLFLNVLDLPQ